MRAGSSTQQAAFTAFSAQRQVGATAVALSAWDHEQLLAPSAETASSLNPGSHAYHGHVRRRKASAATAPMQPWLASTPPK